MSLYEVGFDFGNDWKGLESFDNIDRAWEFYLDKLKEEYCKIGRISMSLCIKENSSRTKFFVKESMEEIAI